MAVPVLWMVWDRNDEAFETPNQDWPFDQINCFEDPNIHTLFGYLQPENY